MRDRKHTAWRKNRKFGDVYGGRTFPKIADRVFNRAHSLQPPGPDQETPILIEDNPSKDYFFPLSAEECVTALRALPDHDPDDITHLWLRRLPSSERRNNPLGAFIRGSGVRLIVLYPWRRDLKLCLGRAKPTRQGAKSFSRYGATVLQSRGWWYVQFTEEQLRRFFVHVLFHEVGHHVDHYRRHWSKANRKVVEEFAEQYALNFALSNDGVINQLVTGDEQS